jgi:hypothetical protein
MSPIVICDLSEDKALVHLEMASVVGGQMPRGMNRYVADGHYAQGGLAVLNPSWKPEIIQPGDHSSHDFGGDCVDDPSGPCPEA